MAIAFNRLIKKINTLNPAVEHWHDSTDKNYRVIVLSSEYKSRAGGIANAMHGYLSALKLQGLLFSHISTHTSGSIMGKALPPIFALFKLRKEVSTIKKLGFIPVAYAHAGESFSLLRKTILLSIAKLFGAKTVLHLHGGNVEYWLNHFFSRSLFFILLSSADSICVLSDHRKNILTKFDKIKLLNVVHNPISIKLENDKNLLNLKKASSSNSITILTMSRLEKGKGIDVTIKALSKLPSNYNLTIAGSGSQFKHLKRMVNTLGLCKRVTFTGWVEGEDKYSLFRKSDIFCLPSHYDSFGLVFLEAMYFELPIIASKWGAIPEVVPDGVAGILVDGQCDLKISQAIMCLENPKVRLKIGTEGKEWAMRQFSISAVGEALKKAISMSKSSQL